MSAAVDETLVRGVDLRAYRPADSYTNLIKTAAGKFDISTPANWVRVPHQGLNIGVSHVEGDITSDGALFEESAPVLQQLEQKLTLKYPKGDPYLAVLMAAADAGTPVPLLFLYMEIDDTNVKGYGGFWSVALTPKTDLKDFVKFEATFKPREYLGIKPHMIGAVATTPTFTVTVASGT